MKTFVASSWKNPDHDRVVRELTTRGFNVYDYRHPPDRAPLTEDHMATPEWPILAARAQTKNFEAILAADFILVCLPSGASTHVEIGFALAAGKPVFTYSHTLVRPDAFHVFCIPIFNLSHTSLQHAVEDFHNRKHPAFFSPEVRL